MNKAQFVILADELSKDPAGIGYAEHGDDYPAIAALLNHRPPISNPVNQPVRAKLITWERFIGLLTADDILALYQQGNLAIDLRNALERNDRLETLALWRGLKLAMSASGISAVQAAASETEPDPNWQSTVAGESRASALGLPHVYDSDVQAVLA